MQIMRKIKAYFLSNFHSSDFGYVLYPFLRILKIFGFAPIKLKNGKILHNKCEQLEWHVTACIWNFLAVVIYIVGFSIGVHHLRLSTNSPKDYDSAIIAHITSWLQISMFFILSLVELLTSWIYMHDLQKLCDLVFEIDRQLKIIPGIKIDYQLFRKKLFRLFWTQFLICSSLSMINCIIMSPDMNIIGTITCIVFICFVPIMLITFKEFQFYNLMLILKSKIDIINEKLQVFVATSAKQDRIFLLVHKFKSFTDIPLTFASNLRSHQAKDDFEEPNTETLQQLLKIYSCITDGIELVLKIFSWHLLLLTLISFGVITVESYNLFALIMHSLEMQPYQVVFVVAWILIQSMAVCLNVSVCSRTANTMSSSVSLLHKIKVNSKLESEACLFYQILQLLSLEILQRKYNFTAAGFFDINYKLITSIVGAVTTYLVIIIQFHLTTNPHNYYNNTAAF